MPRDPARGPDSDFARRFRELQVRYVEEAAQDVRELFELLDTAGGDLPGGEPGARFRKLAHDLRGTGGTYGFDDISRHAAGVERAYDDRATLAEVSAVLERLEQTVRTQVEALAEHEPTA